MPTYDYICLDCGYEFEEFQKMTDAHLETCPKCSGELQRKIGGAGLLFKGSGFYITDYRKEQKKPEDKTESKQEKSKSQKTQEKKTSKDKQKA
jgi:putative FmdB family regulatory protein